MRLSLPLHIYTDGAITPSFVITSLLQVVHYTRNFSAGTAKVYADPL